MEPTRVLVDVRTPLLRELVLGTLEGVSGVRVVTDTSVDPADPTSVDVVVLDEARARASPSLASLLERSPRPTFVLLPGDASWVRCFSPGAPPSLHRDPSPEILLEAVLWAGEDLDPGGSS